MHALLRKLQLRPYRCATMCRSLTQSITGLEDHELTQKVKQDIENYWRPAVKNGQFKVDKPHNKFYVLSMFPYPSGNLHMGHVRVYTIADALSRFYRMCGKNVFQPIGWDGFGLPAENAAIERGVEPAAWTAENTQQMKKQLQALCISFDWSHELSTCQPDYYKWTQQLFLMLHEDGLAYQNEALVNWDPIDQTVLADEQVDAHNRSWRSGAQVEKKLLKQWFIRTTVFAKRLLEGLNDASLQDWRDIINLQRHWLGECDGYAFQLLSSANSKIRVWTKNPEYFKDPLAFIVLKTSHFLATHKSEQPLTVENPFAGNLLPLVFSNAARFPPKCEVYLASPSNNPEDRELQFHCQLGSDLTALPTLNATEQRQAVLEAAERARIGGHEVSSKLQDWLISRQRYWGTPIPIVHCPQCGAVPVPEEQLPVLLPSKAAADTNCQCPKCGSEQAQRETDTMDTFVDSSWYFLRYLDAHNKQQIFDRDLVAPHLPVDLYIGGKEHAVLHLYYARFINHYLHSRGLVPSAEPFKRLLVQGMVMGRTFKVKKTGQYLPAKDVEVTEAKKNRGVWRQNGEPVTISWEKMSKSKYNGVDPMDMLGEYGADATRLIVLADVAPTSHRNWNNISNFSDFTFFKLD